ncbi:MAG: DNA polymerase III subunit gamma/tau [Deltaproteobacteria bacterium]|nr:MAG: DNA polymerase III subunit gamma/tau [Deltaproteobacteria bacterium]
MSYLVLARKYRPADFNAVVHQEHVTTTLKNAIELNRVAHAHIFTGPRGTGKTTIARILGKCMNCFNGPSPIPCENCRSCNEISSGSPSDIIEIDGASNNSVDQIREIRDNLVYKPVHSRYKIYIIDEVHMLSTAAFNALLKSLEEPPPHIIFLFATTEPHKIPVTILSRCQRHDLKRVPLGALSEHLAGLCKNENIDASMESLLNIASTAEGSVRDAMSLLDQAIASAPDNKITLEHINWLIGSSSFPVIKETLDSIFKADRKALINILAELYLSGKDLKIFYSDIANYLRHIIILKINGKEGNLCDISKDCKNELLEISMGLSPQYISRLLDITLKEESKIKYTENIRILMELLFLKLCEIPETKSLEKILVELEKLKASDPGEVYISESRKTEENKIEYKEPVHETDLPPVNVSTDKKQNLKTLSNEEIWLKILEKISKIKMAAGNLLKNNSRFLDFNNDTLKIKAVGSGYHISMLKKESSLIEKTASEIYGKEIRVEFDESFIDESLNKGFVNEKEKIFLQAESNPLVNAVKNKLKGKIIEERLIKNKRFKEE